MSAELPFEVDQSVSGKQLTSHYTVEENSNRDVAIDKLEIERNKRKKNYAQISHDYYELTTENIEFCWNKRFHFAPFLDEESSLRESLAAHDHYLFMCMGVKPGMRGLDAGCGIGEPSRQYAKWGGVHVTGISINQSHVDRATYLAELEGLQEKTNFVRADFCKMPFPDNSFDFVYAQEATCYAPELLEVYTEICRVLKPGGTFGVYEWCMTENFDDKKPLHVGIRQRIERGDGIVNLVKTSQALKAFKMAGFEVQHNYDRALASIPSRPWWCCLDGQTSKFPDKDDWWTVFQLKPWVHNFVKCQVWIMNKLGLWPTRLMDALKTQAQSVYGVRDGAREGIFTNMYMMVGKKPEGWVHPDKAKAKEAAARVAAAAQEKSKTKVI